MKMWIRYLISMAAFYLFAVFQNSFFTSFSKFGIMPNLVIVLFFLFIFFEKHKNSYFFIFCAMSAGFFLDIFSSEYLGVSIVLLLVIGLTAQKIHSLLSERNNKYSFTHFIFLFIFFLLFYNLFWAVYTYIFYHTGSVVSFSVKSILNIIVNLIFASAVFFPYRKIIRNIIDERQLSLFKNN